MNLLDPTPFLMGLGRVSLQAGVLVVVVLLVQQLFRRQLTPRWRCALWLLVAARLLLPVSFGSAASLFNLVPAWNPAVGNRAAAAPAPARTPAAAAETPRPGASPVANSAAAPARFGTGAEAPSSQIPLPEAAGSPLISSAKTQPPARTAAAAWWPAGLFSIWLAGVILLAGYVGYSSFQLARRLSGVKSLTDRAVLDVLDECRRRLGIRHKPPLVESNAITIPALHGLLRPRLLLPEGCISGFSERELRFVFLHELAHLKRRDLPLNWLMALLQIIHWFNPLVWLAFARWRADRELACDALVLEAAGEGQNREYGRTILRLLEGFTHRISAPGLIGIIESKRQLRRRISMIAAHTPTRRWSLLAVLLVLGLGAVGLTDALEKDRASAAAGAMATNTPAPQRLVTDGAAMKVMVLDAETGRPIPAAEVLAPNQTAFFGGSGAASGWVTDQAGVATIRLGTVPTEPTQQNTWFTLSARRAGWAARGSSWSAEKGDARQFMPAELTLRLQRGTTVGGIVRDEAGQPLPGVRVRLFGAGYRYDRSRERSQEYPEYSNTGTDAPPLLTDAAGRWSAADFPRDLENVTLNFTRPDGSAQRFSHSTSEVNPMGNTDGEPFDLAALRAGNAVFVLKSGFTVRGIVLDPTGKPLPGVRVREGHGAGNLVRDGELRTDAAGRFELRNRPRRQMILTASADGFAITSTIVDVGPDTGEVRLQVDPLNPLRIRVLDGDGRAIAGAKLSLVDFRTEGQVLDFEGTTGSDGVFVWTNAPLAPLSLGASVPQGSPFSPFGFGQMVRVAPRERQVTFRLREGMEKELIVRGRARDAATGGPVAVRTVSLRVEPNEPAVVLEQPNGAEFTVKIAASRFRQGMLPGFKLQLEADGYESFVTPSRLFIEGDWEAEFALQRGRSGGTILLVDGRPAAGAEISVPAHEYSPLYMYQPGRAPRDWATTVRADDRGHFEINHPGRDAIVLLSHPDGFLVTSADRLKAQPQLTLQPWGRVEGVLRAGTNVLPRVNVNLSGGPGFSWHFNYTATTDDEGRFAFEKVPPGENLLSRYASRRTTGPVTPGFQMPVTVKPGETARVEYGGTGRPIVGRVDGNADWGNDDHTLTLKLPPAPPHPQLEDFATVAAFEAARDNYSTSVRPRQERDARVYVLRFEPDGSFRVDDVPAGAYELSIRVTEPQKPGERYDYGRQPKELGSLAREVVVPAIPGGRSDEPLDLGTLQLAWKGEPAAPPAVSLTARTLQMKPFDLAEFRGKYVVLAFWASWSERCTEQLAALQKLAADFGRDPRLAIIGVNLDDDLATARQAVDARSYTWSQAWLDAPGRVKATEAFDVNTLPAVCLLDTEGRVVGRDLQGERLRAAVGRALARK